MTIELSVDDAAVLVAAELLVEVVDALLDTVDALLGVGEACLAAVLTGRATVVQLSVLVIVATVAQLLVLACAGLGDDVEDVAMVFFGVR